MLLVKISWLWRKISNCTYLLINLPFDAFLHAVLALSCEVVRVLEVSDISWDERRVGIGVLGCWGWEDLSEVSRLLISASWLGASGQLIQIDSVLKTEIVLLVGAILRAATRLLLPQVSATAWVNRHALVVYLAAVFIMAEPLVVLLVLLRWHGRLVAHLLQVLVVVVESLQHRWRFLFSI